MPNAIQEKLLKQPALKLSDIRKGLVGQEYLCSKLYNTARAEWGDYFQSPVDKTARTLNSAFKFNKFGAFLDGDASEEKEERSDNKGKDNGTDFDTAKDALFLWLGDEDDSILAWLKEGTPLSTEKLYKIKRRLRAETLTNESLYDQPICRLVHRDQLRRDLDYQVVYQVTPGQSKLLNLEQDPRERKSEEPPTQRLKRSQKAYWGISETFQSLVAMFDSDLGTWRDPGIRPEMVTKELIRITADKKTETQLLTPDELNIYSPLRFWSPPPAFSGSVFHMLFWRAVVTGKDLFGREVIKSAPLEMDKVLPGNGNKSSIAERARHYYVVINWFNAAKFRLAAYDRLFETLMAIASFIGRIKSDTPLCEIKKDLILSDPALDELLYPNAPHKFREFPKLNLKLPFKAVDKPIWELAWSHQNAKDQPTQISHLLKFLRDKALELIIWSKYQMEIRSVGLIPCQYLYRIELDPSHIDKLEALGRQFEKDKGLSQEIAGTSTLPEKSAQPLTINQSIINAIENKSIEDWIILKRVCGGTNRTIFDKEAWKDIKCLESPRAKIFSSQN